MRRQSCLPWYACMGAAVIDVVVVVGTADIGAVIGVVMGAAALVVDGAAVIEAAVVGAAWLVGDPTDRVTNKTTISTIKARAINIKK